MAYRELDTGNHHSGVDDALLESSSTGLMKFIFNKRRAFLHFFLFLPFALLMPASNNSQVYPNLISL